MSRPKKIDDLAPSENEGARKERIAIFTRNYVKSVPLAVHMPISTLASYPRGSICRNEKDIDYFIENNAPIEVFFRYVD